MGVRYEDYYARLGVARGASQEEIQKAFRRRARELHPDVNPDPEAEEAFKALNEAYEVLKDPERRRMYDRLGADLKAGQEFRPPPGFEAFGGGGPGGPGGGFSSLFDILAGLTGGGGVGGAGMNPGAGWPPSGGSAQQQHRAAGPRAGRDREAEITVSLEDVYSLAQKQITLRFGDGHTRAYHVRIPPGATEGTAIRLQGQGEPGRGGGPQGALLLRLHIAPHERFEIDGHDLRCELRVAPWEAALGARVPVETLDGVVWLRLPAGTSSGQRLRLRGKGLRKGSEREGRGDLLAELQIVVPQAADEEQRAMWAALAASYGGQQEEGGFDPRGGGGEGAGEPG